ncbi:hypothetical protein BDQ17DRAFT_1388040 [Cyathus striatus]|nr:hypothetical protein BDQ17DRAFT_1388040 [Cyathus striatus]
MSPILSILLVAGVAATIYGIYDIYGTMTMWPVSIRKDLRAGLAAKYKNNLDLSARYFQRAWNQARELPIEDFKSQPYLKTTGIGITLAGILESEGKLELAYNTYVETINQLIQARKPLSGQEHMRTVALAYKLGEMAQMLKKPRDEEERWLTMAVETIMKNVMQKPVAIGEIVSLKDSKMEEESKIMVSELQLPMWATNQDIAAPFEALGSFYSRIGKLDFAMPLYLQAVSILIPPAPSTSSADDKCRGAQLMGNISELIMRGNPSQDSLAQAEAWAQKGLEVADKERKGFRKHAICDVAYAVMLYNLAMVREMSGDGKRARELLVQSLNLSQDIGLEEGVSHAKEALAAIDVGKPQFKPVLPGGVKV